MGSNQASGETLGRRGFMTGSLLKGVVEGGCEGRANDVLTVRLEVVVSPRLHPGDQDLSRIACAELQRSVYQNRAMAKPRYWRIRRASPRGRFVFVRQHTGDWLREYHPELLDEA